MKNEGCFTKLVIGVCAFIAISWFALIISMIIYGDVQPVDRGLKKMMLIDAPDTLIYVAGEDTALDTSDALVRTYQTRFYADNCETRLTEFEEKYVHGDIDFSKADVYLVTVSNKSRSAVKGFFFQYTVQIVNPGEYVPFPPREEESHYWEEAATTFCENATAYMISPPDNIIYPVGYEGEIGLEGVMLKPVGPLFAKTYDIADLDYTLETDADFNTPGSYIVRVNFTDNRGRDLWFCFTVAVAEKVEQ